MKSFKEECRSDKGNPSGEPKDGTEGASGTVQSIEIKRELNRGLREEKGHELLETVVRLTGLPDEMVRCELDQIFERVGAAPASEQADCPESPLTLDQLRLVLAAYLDHLSADFQSENDDSADNASQTIGATEGSSVVSLVDRFKRSPNSIH